MMFSGLVSAEQFNVVVLVAFLFLLIYGYWLFHPLRRYPGPLLAKFTDAVCGYHAFRKDSHLFTYRNLQKYGSGYREAPNRLVFNTIEAVQDIYFNSNVTKSPAYRQAHSMYRPNLFDTTNPHVHRYKRKIIGQALSDRSLRNAEFENIISSQINIFLRQLLHSQDAVDLTPATRHLAVDIIGYMSFGADLSTQTREENRFIVENISLEVYFIYMYYKFPFLRFLAPVLRLFAWNRVNTIEKAIGKMAVARMQMPKNARLDFYSHVPDDNHKQGQKLEDTDLWTDAVLFIGAGGTTVSSAMCATFFHLSRYADVYARLASEIRSVFQSGKEIVGGEKLSGCKYLRAVIDESMRMSPPSLMSLYREQSPWSEDPLVVEGKVIPRGTQVAVNIYSMMHNEEYFPDSFSFKPDRWMNTDTKEFSRMRRANVVFGLAERNCAGKQLAYLETSIVIARTLWYFDFEKVDDVDFRQRDILVVEHDGPLLKFTPRQGFCDELQEIS